MRAVGDGKTYALPIDGFDAVGRRLDPRIIDLMAVYILDKQQVPFVITIAGVDAIA
ncbi:MAG: hypothetical protein AB1925_06970 [Actinomycetota bacterium]